MSASNTTTDHEAIRRWVEQRKGKPARVNKTAAGELSHFNKLVKR
jgi:hypothetical protein